MGELLSKLLGIIEEEEEEEKTPSPTSGSGSGSGNTDEMVSKMVSVITELKELADTNPDEKKCTTGGGLYKNDEKLNLKKVDNTKIIFTVPKGVTNAKLPEGCSMSFSYLNREDDEFVKNIYKERENTIELPKDYDGGTAVFHETKIVEAIDKFHKLGQEINSKDGTLNMDNVNKKLYDEMVQKGYIDSASSGSDQEKMEKFMEKIHIKLGLKEAAIEDIYITLPDGKKGVRVRVLHDGSFRITKKNKKSVHDDLISKIKDHFLKVNDEYEYIFDLRTEEVIRRKKELVTADATNLVQNGTLYSDGIEAPSN